MSGSTIACSDREAQRKMALNILTLLDIGQIWLHATPEKYEYITLALYVSLQLVYCQSNTKLC